MQSKSWHNKQPITIRAAIITSFYAQAIPVLVVLLDRITPGRSVTAVILITPTPDNFIAVTPLPAPIIQVVQLNEPLFQSTTTTSHTNRIQIPKINLDAPVVMGDDRKQLKKGVDPYIVSAYLKQVP